jgi:hypothetical protein
MSKKIDRLSLELPSDVFGVLRDFFTANEFIVDILPSRQNDCIETVSRLDANGNAIIGTNHRWERS